MNVHEIWRTQRQWSGVATRLSDSLNTWRVANLGLILFGAVTGALAAQQAWFARPVTVALGAASAGALALAGVIQTRFLSAERVQRRLSARAAAEALKGAVFRYLADVPSPSSSDRSSELATAATEVSQLAGAHAGLIMGAPVDDRALPQVRGIAEYVRGRAEEQRTWHATRMTDHQRRSRRWRGAELAATAAAAVIATVGAALHGPDLSAWVAVATTAAAAFAAHLASQQHDRVAESYARTVQRLNTLLANFDPTRGSPEQAAKFVANVESVLADQNDSWVSIFTVH